MGKGAAHMLWGKMVYRQEKVESHLAKCKWSHG